MIRAELASIRVTFLWHLLFQLSGEKFLKWIKYLM